MLYSLDLFDFDDPFWASLKRLVNFIRGCHTLKLHKHEIFWNFLGG
jgi:hypothetical protein